MLRIEFYKTPHGITVRLQGRFVKEFAEHACMLIGESSEPSQFIVDLSDMTFVDAVGERVMIRFKELGVAFTADSAYCLDICERLNLPLAASFNQEAKLSTFTLAGETEAERVLSGSTAGLPQA
jgi:hypothetical protein